MAFENLNTKRGGRNLNEKPELDGIRAGEIERTERKPEIQRGTTTARGRRNDWRRPGGRKAVLQPLVRSPHPATPSTASSSQTPPPTRAREGHVFARRKQRRKHCEPQGGAHSTESSSSHSFSHPSPLTPLTYKHSATASAAGQSHTP